MLKIRLFLILLLAAIIGTGSWYLLGRGRSGKEIRNVLLISIDTCRADHLSCYGYPRKTTPNIDTIAEEGILFENVITPAPLTLPAHSSMLTGTIPPYHRVHDNMDIKFGGSNVTLAGILKGNGFTTGAIVSAFVLDHQFGLDEGFHSYNDSFEEEHKAGNISERKGGEATSFALDWLQENKDENFFLFLHYYDPHVEYEPPAPFSSRFMENPYAGEIAYTDYCIGQVIEKLKELDLYDSTLLVITSDHGEALGDHNELTHGYFIYQSTLRVPLIFKVPGGPESVRIVDTAGLIDIVPTICGLLGVPVPSQVHGKDLSRHFMEKTYSAEERYFYCESFVSTKYDCNHLLGVVGDRWKYIQTTRPELYDLVKDPRESNNLATTEASRARILQGHLQQILEQTVRKTEADSKVELDDEARSRLESLGYVASSSVSEDFEFDQSKDDPKDVIDFHNSHARANHLISQERYVEAKNICQKLLSQRSNCFVVHLSMTKIALEQEDFEGALPHFYQALKFKPDRYDIHNNLGIALTHLGKFEQAVKHHLKALKINPDHADTHNNLGRALREQG
ncbi:MAG: sulfatase, partial [Planctomycetota bacterium]